ncbi:hypothetical protein BDA99DRAFT_600431 [Phascolomyces articulosus]|uniref:Uncharacterized protein n=1 Tax=Phascolomyces articulosus TaxID=60185 RepID=A0AAD5KSL7_9FUNG|nr:hypothetical protein BDA99DRAFT_600431 [Phascolomyces articulosus]
MKLVAVLALLGVTVVAVRGVPVEEEAAPLHHLVERDCLPASCVASGCCSGNCGYWCRQCKVDYTC